MSPPPYPLYDQGPETNRHTHQHLGTIIDVLAEAGWDPDGLVRMATEAMEPSAMHQRDGVAMQECIVTYLASAGQPTGGLPGLVWPGVTPIDDDTDLDDSRDALALAMCRGYIEWRAVATAIYWTAYVGEGWEGRHGLRAAWDPDSVEAQMDRADQGWGDRMPGGTT